VYSRVLAYFKRAQTISSKPKEKNVTGLEKRIDQAGKRQVDISAHFGREGEQCLMFDE
jgi:hypothetical protein